VQIKATEAIKNHWIVDFDALCIFRAPNVNAHARASAHVACSNLLELRASGYLTDICTSDFGEVKHHAIRPAVYVN
jgi:hypothetical protein